MVTLLYPCRVQFGSIDNTSGLVCLLNFMKFVLNPPWKYLASSLYPFQSLGSYCWFQNCNIHFRPNNTMPIPRITIRQSVQLGSVLSLFLSNFLIFQAPSYTDLNVERHRIQNRMSNIETKMARSKGVENELGPPQENSWAWFCIRREPSPKSLEFMKSLIVFLF